MWIKIVAFIPCAIGFAIFFILIAVYGRIQTSNSKSDENKTSEL